VRFTFEAAAKYTTLFEKEGKLPNLDFEIATSVRAIFWYTTARAL
jgi:hypothetical protein